MTGLRYTPKAGAKIKQYFTIQNYFKLVKEKYFICFVYKTIENCNRTLFTIVLKLTTFGTQKKYYVRFYRKN